MTVTTTPPSARVDDLGASEVLACLADAEGAERRAALSKLELALHWCVLHPATADTGAAVWGDAGLPGLSGCDETLGGDGCPAVSAFAPELSTPSADGPIADSPFAAALAISTSAGMQLLADGLDLAHRLPRTWGEVRALTVPAWKARRLARATHHLSRAAAAQVDRRLADRIGPCGPALIDREVAQAAATFDPDQHAEREAASRDTWDVALFHHSDGGFAGTSELHATGDTLDLTSFYDVVCDQAAHLARLGDTDSLGARKAKALGLMAGHQSHLDLYGDPSAQRSRDNAESRPPLRRPTLARTRLYLHLRLTDLLDPTTKVGYAERL